MKQPPHLAEAQKQMQPGVITSAGFLGDDPRGLAEILDDDDARVRRLGLTHEAIAARMRELRDAGAAGLGERTDVPPHFQVRVESVRGKLPCPFGDRCLVQKGFTAVKNTATGETVTFTDLAIHLIEAHGFYQGRGSPFRLDPERIAAVLDLRGGADIP
jgi:hypothetical protein